MAEALQIAWPMDVGGPANTHEARRPYVDNGEGAPDPARYYSAQWMQWENERLWPRVWLLAGVASDIPDPGDFFTFELGGESLVVVRQRDGSVRSFFNACPHRGTRVALAERGSVDRFTCSFHGWEFGCDGGLLKITDEHTFRSGVVAHRPGLAPVRTETHCGLVFVNLDGKAPPLKQYLGLPDGYLEAYEIDRMHVVQHVQSEWAANWKTGQDSFVETYHLPFVHPQTCTVMEYYSQQDLFENGASRMIVPFCVRSHQLEDRTTVDAGLQMMLRDAGIDPAGFVGDATAVRQAVQRAKRARAERLGLAHYRNFTDGQLVDSWPTTLFPNVQLGLHPEGVFVHRFLPHQRDPERFTYDTMILYRHVDAPGYAVPAWMGLAPGTDTTGETRLDARRVPLGQRPELGQVLDQDSELLPMVQAGIRSRGFKGPLWSEQELRIRHLHRELDRYVYGEK
ncbi:MAG: aromatic ring-hydroxylating dioxygenase subunit alpha [Steroidobacteraceae bacterium]|jgi:phenylpropionate dioxygenase-like ring-hydroxylating dioxygenase large terminal subunit|nr:aromatic ring-hydroxylating dioxygenase subunit alpha [Steroidobacteraceae bacterium]